MPRWTKILLKILAILIGILLILWIALACYITYNKKSLLKTVTAQLKDKVNGELKIGSIDLEVFSSFPNMSVALKDIAVRDSLWQTHKHDLINARFLYVDIDLKSIVKGKPVINDIRLKDGNIYLFTDSTDYSNTSAIKKKDPNKKKKGNTPEFENIELTNIRFTIENQRKFKLFNILIKSLDGSADYALNGDWDAKLYTNAFIKNFCFNSTRGSFLQNKTLKGNILLHFDNSKKHMEVPEQTLSIDGNPITLKGVFDFSVKQGPFHLFIGAKHIMLREATAMLTKPISGKINLVNLDRPVDAHAFLVGRMKFRDTPWVRAYWTVPENTLHTPEGAINNCSFTGFYTNQVTLGGSHGDDNSAIHLYNMKGAWNKIPFFIDSANMLNLKNPVLEGRLRSSFTLTKINAITSGNTFNFTKGDAKVNLLFKVNLVENDTTVPYIYGTVKVAHAGITYTPRNLAFINSSGTLNFTGSDLGFADIHLQSKGSVLNMEGDIKDFMHLFYTSPEKAVINWRIKSPKIDVSDFLVFTSRARYVVQASSSHPKIRKMINRLNTLLDKGSANLDIHIDQVNYRHFTSSDVKADIALNSTDVTLHQIQLKHADGTLQLKGKLQPGNTTTPFSLNADISHVHVGQLFYAFDNFGQDAITSQNIQGILTAETNVTGTMRNNGQIVPHSINGQVSFYLTDGALVHFDPLERMGRIIFRNRDMSHITFKKIANTLQIQGSKIVIDPMAIESSVLNVYLKGVYSLDTGTHIDMEIPLRNPKKDELIVDEEKKEEKRHKGIILYLQATDGDNGKVKIKWTPFKGKKIAPDSSL